MRTNDVNFTNKYRIDRGMTLGIGQKRLHSY